MLHQVCLPDESLPGPPALASRSRVHAVIQKIELYLSLLGSTPPEPLHTWKPSILGTWDGPDCQNKFDCLANRLGGHPKVVFQIGTVVM